MYRPTPITEKYDYILLDETAGDFNIKALDLQNNGYEQQGLPIVYTNKNDVTKIKLMFRKLIYKAEYTQCGTLIRDYNFK